jgi:hypothetical protein
MDEIISYKMCAVKVRNAKLRNYLKVCEFGDKQNTHLKACFFTHLYLANTHLKVCTNTHLFRKIHTLSCVKKTCLKVCEFGDRRCVENTHLIF